MQITALSCVVPFGRELTKKERKEFVELQEKAKEQLGINTTTATVFDFSIPKKEHDTGIGTSFSEDAQRMVMFLKTMSGINSIQLQPQGQISKYIYSPYSGTTFSLGMHIIDLNKLSEREYGSLLKKEDFENSYMNRKLDKNNVDYENVLSDNGQKAMLKKAYDRFLKLDSESELKQDFKKFQKDNEYWLRRDALYEAALAANNEKPLSEWEKYKDVFKTKDGDEKSIKELENIQDKDGRNIVDFEEFVQFIADKQQKESRVKFNKKGIEIFGDCQIGFSQKDIWTHPNAFSEDLEFGCEVEDKKTKNKFISCWSRAIDFDKLDGEAGELLKNKFDTFFKRYDGVRIDAAWQLVKPMLVTPQRDENGNFVFDEHGNKLGYYPEEKNQRYVGSKIIGDIAVESAKRNGIKSNSRIFLEMLGGNSYDSLPAVKDLGATLIHITKYASDGWGRVKFYESEGNSINQNLKPGEYTIGAGTHDDESLISQYDEYGKKRAGHLARDLNLNSDELMSDKSKWTSAVFSELLTTKNQFATLPDILGSTRRINTPDVQEGNWLYRVGDNYKKEYYDNLSNGYGLNFPEVLSTALKAQGRTSELTDKLDHYAEILREKEPKKGKTINIEY